MKAYHMTDDVLHPRADLCELRRCHRPHAVRRVRIGEHRHHDEEDLEAEIVEEEDRQAAIREEEPVRGPADVRLQEATSSGGVHW